MTHRTFIEERFDLKVQTFEPIGNGWAYDTYEVNGEWIFQFPRLPGEDETLRKQIAMLPELAREVSAAIPEPRFASVDPPCLGYRKIEGRPFTELEHDGIWPERLGRFLYDLHTVPPEFVGMRARGPEHLREELRSELAEFERRILRLLSAQEHRLFAELFESHIEDEANWCFATCITHGDLGPEHILVTPVGDLAGVIDWGDADVADPVADFAWLLEARPEEGERALAAYGGAPDDRFRERARFAFLLMPWHEVNHGLVTDQPEFVTSGLAGLRERLP